MDALLQWFTSHGGTVDYASIGFQEFADCGRGAIALRDIEVRQPELFRFGTSVTSTLYARFPI